MHYISRSKVGKVNPNPRSSYPLIRLPQQYNDFVGKTAHIFKTEHQGQQALFILFDNGGGIAPNIIQSVYNFIQLETEASVESRLLAIESKIEKIIGLIFSNQNLIEVKKEENSGLEAIRTPDLRHVKATS